MTDLKPTFCTFHHDGQRTTMQTKLLSTLDVASLDESDAGLFKHKTENDRILTTAETIFHPQGGGQPSDEGTITSTKDSDLAFTVTAARSSVTHPGLIYHLGHFNAATSSSSDANFADGELVSQTLDVEKRRLYSRYHTAGHVLGAAVRRVVERDVEGFDELKASHFPDSAACEFAGSIPGTFKAAIQQQVDEFVASDLPVEIDWWDEDDFKREGKESLLPDRKFLMPGETKFRVVKVVGADVYPCGGTHVLRTRECGPISVKKISRAKGVSRVSYSVQ